ncbi:MAG: hypothetical protein V4653_17820 [Pseudomonadota bacterium]
MARPLRSLCLALLLLAGAALPRPAAAQSGDGEFAELAAASFGMVCLFLAPDDIDDGARILGLTAIPDPALVARMMPRGPARGWSMLHSARVLFLARRDQDGACLLELIGMDESQLFNAVDRLLRRLNGTLYRVVEEEVPRGLPRPPLRARYRVSAQDNSTVVIQFMVEQQPGIGRRLQVVLSGG